MSGIGDYFHGEEGQVIVVDWLACDEYLAYSISLRGDPHRIRAAQDYGSDIGIDPLIQPSDKVIYLRLDSTGGIWVEKGHQRTPELEAALFRVQASRCRPLRYLSLLRVSRIPARFWAKSLPYTTGRLAEGRMRSFWYLGSPMHALERS